MRIIDIEQRSDEWKAFREEKISGTKIGKLFSKSRKSGQMFDLEKPSLMFYQILAERLTTGSNDAISGVEAMQRGCELEAEAVEIAVAKLGLDGVRTDGVWQDSDNEHFICSPDAYQDSKTPKWAMEVKCLSSANHIKAIVEDEYPGEYFSQAINYFLINPDLQVLYFVMYDPRFFSEELQTKIFLVKRHEIEAEIKLLAEARAEAEARINEIVGKVSF